MKIAMIMLGLILTSCVGSDIKTSNINPQGTLPEGYELKRFSVPWDSHMGTDTVYVLYKNGVPYAGTGTSYRQGKATVAVSSAIIDDTAMDTAVEKDLRDIQALKEDSLEQIIVKINKLRALEQPIDDQIYDLKKKLGLK